MPQCVPAVLILARGGDPAPVSWPAKAGHPRLFWLPRTKDVGGRPSPAMTRGLDRRRSRKMRTAAVRSAGRTARRLSPAEQRLDLGPRQLQEGRPAVAAGGGARRRLHLAQQRVHLRRVQPPPGADRAVAGQAARSPRPAAPPAPWLSLQLGQLVGQVAQQRRRLRRAERRRQRAHQHRAGAERLDLQPEPRQRPRRGPAGGRRRPAADRPPRAAAAAASARRPPASARGAPRASGVHARRAGPPAPARRRRPPPARRCPAPAPPGRRADAPAVASGAVASTRAAGAPCERQLRLRHAGQRQGGGCPACARARPGAGAATGAAPPGGHVGCRRRRPGRAAGCRSAARAPRRRRGSAARSWSGGR